MRFVKFNRIDGTGFQISSIKFVERNILASMIPLLFLPTKYLMLSPIPLLNFLFCSLSNIAICLTLSAKVLHVAAFRNIGLNIPPWHKHSDRQFAWCSSYTQGKHNMFKPKTCFFTYIHNFQLYDLHVSKVYSWLSRMLTLMYGMYFHLNRKQ